MDIANLIAFSVLAGTVGISVSIAYGWDRLRRGKLNKHFQTIQSVLDPGTASVWPGPELKGSFLGRQLYAFRRVETIGYSGRGGGNPKTIVDFGCSTQVQFTAFTHPTSPLLAELLRVGSPRIALGDPAIDLKYGFATPAPDGFLAWMARPDNRKCLLDLMALMPPCSRQRFRVQVEGKLELNIPEYLFVRMTPEMVRRWFAAVDILAQTLEKNAI